MIQKFRKSIPYALPVIVAILVIGLILSRVAAPEADNNSFPDQPEATISVFEAAKYADRYVNVCGNVASAEFLPEVNGQPTFLNFGDIYPDQVFTAVIFGENRKQFRYQPEIVYANESVCIKGRIKIHQNMPQIEIKSSSQIKIND